MRLYKRRLVSILSGDVASFCFLMHLNEDATVTTLRRYRAAIAARVDAHRGRMFGVAGDSWMAEFANPIDAVNCAQAIQHELARANAAAPSGERVSFRMGVHMGDVIADDVDLFGNVLNVAARLQEIAPAGGFAISAVVLSHVTGKVDMQFAPLGAQRLKNIEEPVEAYRAEISFDLAASAAEVPSVINLAEPVPGFDRRPAVAVLPFANPDRSPSLDYIGDGFADDLINGLSRAIWFPVIARCSSFAFRTVATDAKAIGRALGARYLISGSVRSFRDIIRLTVSLTNSETSVCVWSACYDIAGVELLTVQDEILNNVVSIVDAEVDRAEQNRSVQRPSDDLNTWEMVRAGVWHMDRFTKEDSVKARALLEEALIRAPRSPEASIQLGWWYFWDVWSQRGEKSGLKMMSELAWQALKIDDRDARAHLLLGIADVMTGKPVAARSRLEEAIRLNPSLAAAHATLGSSYILASNPASAVDPLLISLRLNPQGLYRFHFLGELAMAFYLQEHWAKACAFAERSLQLRPGYWYSRAILIASLAQSGRVDKAREALAEHERDYGRIKCAQIEWLPFVDPVSNKKLMDGLNQSKSGVLHRLEKAARGLRVARI